VASTDGVGTKAQIASAVGRYDTIGLDLVAMNVDDIVVYGARPLFFLDFVMTGAVDPGQVEDIVRGVANGCKQVGCALLGGEVAEHPGTMGRGEFDLVGFVVGSVDRKELITGTSIRPGDRVIGLTAPGLRSDGYSFVRKIFADRSLNEPAYPDADHSLGDELLRPSAILTPMVLDLLRAVDVHGLAHVTGGGIAANAARILPPDCDLVLHRGSWPVPPIFVEMRRSRGITTRAMEDAFGLGIGMVVVVPPEAEEQALQILARGAVPTPTLTIGEVTPGSGRAAFAGASQEVFWREKL
jgi:phosphoribosylformylglycinamidine cyclo-ligase